MHGVQSQVSELALCKEGEGTHDWIFVGIVVRKGLTCSATSCGQTQFPLSLVIQQVFIEYFRCVRACASA